LGSRPCPNDRAELEATKSLSIQGEKRRGGPFARERAKGLDAVATSSYEEVAVEGGKITIKKREGGTPVRINHRQRDEARALENDDELRALIPSKVKPTSRKSELKREAEHRNYGAVVRREPLLF